MTIIRTSHLAILSVWLAGGQVNEMGNYSEGFHDLTDKHSMTTSGLIKNNKLDKEKLKEIIIILIDEYGSKPGTGKNGAFLYYGYYYKFRLPSNENLNKLVEKIALRIEVYFNE